MPFLYKGLEDPHSDLSILLRGKCPKTNVPWIPRDDCSRNSLYLYTKGQIRGEVTPGEVGTREGLVLKVEIVTHLEKFSFCFC
jgi:hypothetical protein